MKSMIDIIFLITYNYIIKTMMYVCQGGVRWAKSTQNVNFLSVSALIVGCPRTGRRSPKSLPGAGPTRRGSVPDPVGQKRESLPAVLLSRDLGHTDRGCQQTVQSDTLTSHCGSRQCACATAKALVEILREQRAEECQTGSTSAQAARTPGTRRTGAIPAWLAGSRNENAQPRTVGR